MRRGERATSALGGALCFLVPMLLLMGSELASSFKCPDNRHCSCFEESPGEHKIRCLYQEDGSSFELTVVPPESLHIECTNNPSWSNFLHNSTIDVGQISQIRYLNCRPPSRAEDSYRVANLIGARGIKRILYKNLEGTLSSHDLEPYPDLIRLNLSENDIRNVSVDLLKGNTNFFYLLYFIYALAFFTALIFFSFIFSFFFSFFFLFFSSSSNEISFFLLHLCSHGFGPKITQSFSRRSFLALNAHRIKRETSTFCLLCVPNQYKYMHTLKVLYILCTLRSRVF